MRIDKAIDMKRLQMRAEGWQELLTLAVMEKHTSAGPAFLLARLPTVLVAVVVIMLQCVCTTPCSFPPPNHAIPALGVMAGPERGFIDVRRFRALALHGSLDGSIQYRRS